MRWSLSPHRSSFVAGTALAAITFLTMGQYQIPRAQQWGPPKQDVVNVCELDLSIVIPPGGTATIYTVPADRWLTLTAVSAGLAYSSPPNYLAEDLDGTISVKGTASGLGIYSSPEGRGDAIGWTFRPGSRVVVRAGANGPATLVAYSLLGYLSRS
jgi:hypothetical protein